MAVGRKVQQALDGILGEGEEVLCISHAQLKRGSGTKRLAKDVGISLAISAATSVIGFGVMRNTMPPLVWIAVTPQRLLMLSKSEGNNSVGELVFDAPLDALVLTDVTKLMGTLLVDDAESGDNIAKLNFGALKLRKNAATIAAAGSIGRDRALDPDGAGA